MKDRVSKKDTIISDWLDSEYEISDPPIYRLNYIELYDYYKYNDKNLKLNDTDKIKELVEFGEKIKKGDTKYSDNYEKRYQKKLIFESKLVQTFSDGDNLFHHFLNPKTPRYHANMLFNQIIDHCIKHNYYDDNGDPLINKMLRNKFYEFCYNNTK